MSTEIHTSTPGSKSRRKVVIAAVLASIALLSTGAVAFWSGDSWSDEAMSSGGFPGLPGGDWSSTTSDDGWGSADTSTAATSGAGATGATGARRPGTTRPRATAVVVEPASHPTSSVPTTTAPAPSPSQATTAPAPSSTAAPSPRPTRGNPRPKPTSTKKPIPTPSPSPTSSDGGCVLLVIC
ncbi:hypothetical protein [Terrabacter sp. Soil810]|uniref:hypothetical protein n=1 Tax=Terrabacter sp. Soil810 TaxID=1736418 RepID=UPI00070EC8F4|nr:hypothetical protein [Terrabacter sp. Soil810]KRF40218.1 hypothetical protein ASG96_04735 [Terrabacter sp. Soil810]